METSRRHTSTPTLGTLGGNSFRCYSVDPDYFASSGLERDVLRVPAGPASGGNGVYAYGGSGTFPTQTWRHANYWVDVVFEPANGAPVAANDGPFGTAMDTSVLILASDLLANDVDPDGDTLAITSVGEAINGTVAFDAQTGQAVFTPQAGYLVPASFVYTVSDGGGGTADATVAVVVQTDAWSLWPASATPAVVTHNDPNGVNLGVKFRADADGYVTGLRFYRGSDNDGPHEAFLWTDDGQLLGNAELPAAGSAGWQHVTLAPAIPIAAGALYVASYHTAPGYYSADSSYFNSPRRVGPLTAPSSRNVGGNGVYAYGGAGLFPSQTYRATNYWVDIVFQSIPPAGDTESPTPPSSLIATAASASRIDLAWGAPSDDTAVAGDEVARDGSLVASMSSTSFSDTGFSPGTSYDDAVRAFDPAGNVSDATTASATTHDGAPPAPPPTCHIALGIGADLGGAVPLSAASAWNRDVSEAPVAANSAAIIAGTGPSAGLRPEFGSGRYSGSRIGIPYVVVPEDQPLVPINFTTYAGESDPGPYPIPPNAPIEGDGGTADYYDRHVLVVQRDANAPECLGRLYELFYAEPVGNYPNSVERWDARGGAVFDLKGGDLQRGDGWSSTDAAGLPIFPGLVRYDEVQRAIEEAGEQGVIPHALRFTLAEGYTANAYVPPAQHFAGWNNGPAPFGMRVRLRADWYMNPDFPIEVKVIVNTLKTYGMIMADNGGNWFISGAPDERWDNDRLRYLGYITGGDFEVVAP
jgi:Domain of unknown function (DUF4082)/Cadherin-like domain